MVTDAKYCGYIIYFWSQQSHNAAPPREGDPRRGEARRVGRASQPKLRDLMKERGCAAYIHVTRGRRAPRPLRYDSVEPVEPKYISTYIVSDDTYMLIWVCVLCICVFLLCWTKCDREQQCSSAKATPCWCRARNSAVHARGRTRLKSA